MKFATALDPILSSITKVHLLRKLFGAPLRQWTGRELASAAGVSTAQAARDLHDLSDAGIVNWDVHGRSFAWYLNRDNALFTELLQLFHHEADLRSELVHRMAVEFRSEPIERARIFGSVARGDERQDSDVDLFVEIKNTARRHEVEAALDRVRDRVWKEFGNPVAPLVYTAAKVKRPPNPALLATIEREGIEIPHTAEGR